MERDWPVSVLGRTLDSPVSAVGGASDWPVSVSQNVVLKNDSRHNKNSQEVENEHVSTISNVISLLWGKISASGFGCHSVPESESDNLDKEKKNWEHTL